MKNNNFLIFGVIIISLLSNLSCSDDDLDDDVIEPTDNFNIASYHQAYVHFDLMIFSFLSEGTIKLEYDNQDRLIKKIGNVFEQPIHPISDYDGILHDSLYTDFEYIGNKIYLERKVNPFEYVTTIPENKTTIILENNRIIQKINFEETESYHRSPYDTIKYGYDNNGKLISYIKSSYFLYQLENEI